MGVFGQNIKKGFICGKRKISKTRRISSEYSLYPKYSTYAMPVCSYAKI